MAFCRTAGTEKPGDDQAQGDLELDDRRSSLSQEETNGENFSSPTASSPEKGDWSSSQGPRLHPRLRQRSIPGSPVAVIQRSAAVDYDEGEEEGRSVQQGPGSRSARNLESDSNGTDTDVETVPPPPPPPGEGLPAFPSLPDAFLKKLGLYKDTRSCDALSEQDIETKFTSLSLAFKTDKITLGSRLELQERQRDLAEKNMDGEISQLKTTLNNLNHLCTNSETTELINKIQRQVDMLQQSTERVSSSAEIYGAVQQESRVSKAIEVMLLHVENLKRMYEKEHHELEETKRVLLENNIVVEEGVDQIEDPHMRTSRYRSLQSLIGASKLSGPSSKRRASIAALPRPPSSAEQFKSAYTVPLTFGETKNKAVGMVRVGSYNHLARRPSLSPTMKLSYCQNDILSSTNDSIDSSSKLDGFSGMDDIKEITESKKDGSEKDSENGSDIAEENNNCKMDEFFNQHVVDGEVAEFDSYRFETESSDCEHEDLSLENDDEVSDGTEKYYDAMKSPFQLERNTSVREYMVRLAAKTRTAINDVSWPWDIDQTLLHIRYCITGLLLFAALVSLVSTFVPASADERRRQPVIWTSVAEIFGPYVTLRHYRRPPT